MDQLGSFQQFPDISIQGHSVKNW